MAQPNLDELQQKAEELAGFLKTERHPEFYGWLTMLQDKIDAIVEFSGRPEHHPKSS